MLAAPASDIPKCLTLLSRNGHIRNRSITSVWRRFSGFSDGSDQFRRAIQTLTRDSILETELRCDDYLVSNRGQRFADEFFVRKRTISFRGIEESSSSARFVLGTKLLQAGTKIGLKICWRLPEQFQDIR
jgi:hypothetical protein